MAQLFVEPSTASQQNLSSELSHSQVNAPAQHQYIASNNPQRDPWHARQSFPPGFQNHQRNGGPASSEMPLHMTPRRNSEPTKNQRIRSIIPHQDGLGDGPFCLAASCVVRSAVNVEKHRVVKMDCSNRGCTLGNLMHRECFVAFEEEVLKFMRKTGRAKAWSEKQRRNNMWDDKGYNLIKRICKCRCGKGYLRKDLSYVQPGYEFEHQQEQDHRQTAPSECVDGIQHKTHVFSGNMATGKMPMERPFVGGSPPSSYGLQTGCEQMYQGRKCIKCLCEEVVDDITCEDGHFSSEKRLAGLPFDKLGPPLSPLEASIGEADSDSWEERGTWPSQEVQPASSWYPSGSSGSALVQNARSASPQSIPGKSQIQNQDKSNWPPPLNGSDAAVPGDLWISNSPPGSWEPLSQPNTTDKRNFNHTTGLWAPPSPWSNTESEPLRKWSSPLC
eukprot:m.17021 g.17021  ORF g.17021 m.17021 type:complete len:445 (+) comp5870_c0_seq2:136-1470(+)